MKKHLSSFRGLVGSSLITAVGTMAATPALAQVTTVPTGLRTDIDVQGYGTNDPETIVINLVNWVLGILALIAVVLFLAGGFLWMTAAGNDDKVDQAKKLIVAAIIGMVIILAAWGISLYAISVLGAATGVEGFSFE